MKLPGGKQYLAPAIVATLAKGDTSIVDALVAEFQIDNAWASWRVAARTFLPDLMFAEYVLLKQAAEPPPPTPEPVEAPPPPLTRADLGREVLRRVDQLIAAGVPLAKALQDRDLQPLLRQVSR